MIKHKIEFQDYEVERLLKGLDLLIDKSGRKWEQQPNGQWHYTDNKESKRLKFIQRSIKRQIAEGA